MKHSEQINEVITSLLKAQGEFEKVIKKDDNPQFKSKYADLATVIAATLPTLNKHNLVILQGVQGDAEKSVTRIETMLAHISGQWISDILEMPATMRDRFDAQSMGSAITYGRRYAWQAMCGVASEDDDGNAATGRGTKEAAQSVAAEKIAVAKKVSVTFSPDDTMFVWGPGCALIDTVLKSSGMKNVLGQWAINKKDGPDVLKALGESGIEVKEEPYQVSPAAAPKAEAVKPRPSLPADEVRGLISEVKTLKTKKGQPYMSVTIDGITGSVFDNADLELVSGDTTKLFVLLNAAKGEMAHAHVQRNGQYTNFTAFMQIGQDCWDLIPDGPPIPVRQSSLL